MFFLGSVWKGYYEYLGKRQLATLTVDAFNATSSKVNATFKDMAQVELRLAGRWGAQHIGAACPPMSCKTATGGLRDPSGEQEGHMDHLGQSTRPCASSHAWASLGPSNMRSCPNPALEGTGLAPKAETGTSSSRKR